MAFRGLLAGTVLAALVAGCGGAATGEAAWPPTAKKWFDRAEASYRTADMEDAELAVENALRLLPQEAEVRLLAARIALARLEYDRAIQLLEGIESTDAASLRGRAYWYDGQVERAADELERLIADPEVKDVWATEVAKLARRGTGRKPFTLSGGLLAVSEMPQVSATSLVVPLEVNGEPALGLIATGTAEAVVDSSRGGESTWLSLRFGERVEVRDVPALAKDLSGISRQLNAPIKILIGVNLLRHLHPTFDFTGGQFVVRTFEPPPPPHATTVHLSYVRGGGMMMRGSFGTEQTAPSATFMIDTSMSFPLALDDGGWKKAGVSLSSLRDVPNLGNLRAGILPMLRLGAFELPDVPGVYGAPVGDLEKGLDMNLDGLVGSGLLAPFRVTLVDRGRTMWLEDMPREAASAPRAPEDMPIPNDELTPPGQLENQAPESSAPPAKPAPAKPASGKAAPAP
jgi:hypothetical protein